MSTCSPKPGGNSEDWTAFERLLGDLSARFVATPADQVDAAIEDAQRQIALALGLDRSSLWQQVDEGQDMVLTHTWVRPGMPAAPRLLHGRAVPWTVAQLGRGRVVRFDALAALPEEAATDRALFERLGPKSGVAFPLSAGGKVFGALAFGILHAERSWSETAIERLAILAQVFANALWRKRAEEALRASEGLARSLARGLIKSSLEERKRLATALHDRVAQPLASLALDLEGVARDLGDAGRALRQRVLDVNAALRALASSTNDLSYRLDTRTLEALGLSRSISAECAAFTARTTIPVSLRDDLEREQIGPEPGEVILRALQECLCTIEHHARAGSIEVTLAREPGGFRMTISADGVGLDPCALNAGRGLSLRQLAFAVGGSIRIGSDPGQSMTVELLIPEAS
jgi:signal transduction histidine kinase